MEAHPLNPFQPRSMLLRTPPPPTAKENATKAVPAVLVLEDVAAAPVPVRAPTTAPRAPLQPIAMIPAQQQQAAPTPSRAPTSSVHTPKASRESNPFLNDSAAVLERRPAPAPALGPTPAAALAPTPAPALAPTPAAAFAPIPALAPIPAPALPPQMGTVVATAKPAMAISDLRARVAAMRRPAERPLQSPTLTTGRRSAAANRMQLPSPPSPGLKRSAGDDFLSGSLDMQPMPELRFADSPQPVGGLRVRDENSPLAIMAGRHASPVASPGSSSPAEQQRNQEFRDEYRRTKARLVELNATLAASTAVLAQLQLQSTSLDEAIAAKRANAERLLPQLVDAGLDPGLFGGVDGLCTPETVEQCIATVRKFIAMQQAALQTRFASIDAQEREAEQQLRDLQRTRALLEQELRNAPAQLRATTQQLEAELNGRRARLSAANAANAQRLAAEVSQARVALAEAHNRQAQQLSELAGQVPGPDLTAESALERTQRLRNRLRMFVQREQALAQATAAFSRMA